MPDEDLKKAILEALGVSADELETVDSSFFGPEVPDEEARRAEGDPQSERPENLDPQQLQSVVVPGGYEVNFEEGVTGASTQDDEHED